MRKLMKLRRAQVGDTLTWIVATLAIIAVLGISITAVKFIGISTLSKNIKIPDREKDFLATESITSFLSDDENVKALESNNEEIIEKKISPLLSDILGTYRENPGSWNLEIENEKNEVDVITYSVVGFNSKFDVTFSNKIKLHFWKECQGGCN